jgi:hypothetical protein
MNVRQIWSTCDLSITGLMDGREERAAGTGFGTLSSRYIGNGGGGSCTGTIKYTKRCRFGDLNSPGTTAIQCLDRVPPSSGTSTIVKRNYAN